MAEEWFGELAKRLLTAFTALALHRWAAIGQAEPIIAHSCREENAKNQEKMNSHWLLHKCNKLPKDGIKVFYSVENTFRKTGTWQLAIHCDATLEDLENNHIFEEEGGTVWETFLEITHCPFCGIYLLEVDHPKYDDVGYFVHYDHREWEIKKQ
ncbi:MAG TPA: hypothetical protein PKI62_14125 [bacterium]|nr:hypothetical protein [bacterium]